MADAVDAMPAADRVDVAVVRKEAGPSSPQSADEAQKWIAGEGVKLALPF